MTPDSEECRVSAIRERLEAAAEAQRALDAGGGSVTAEEAILDRWCAVTHALHSHAAADLAFLLEENARVHAREAADDDDCEERSTLLTITVRKDGTAYVDGKGRHWETSGHRIVLRTPAGGELEIAWPEDFNGSDRDADFADRLDEALAVKNPDEAVARCWELVKELRAP